MWPDPIATLRLEIEKRERDAYMLKRRQLECDNEMVRLGQQREIEFARAMQQRQQQTQNNDGCFYRQTCMPLFKLLRDIPQWKWVIVQLSQSLLASQSTL